MEMPREEGKCGRWPKGLALQVQTEQPFMRRVKRGWAKHIADSGDVLPIQICRKSGHEGQQSTKAQLCF